MLTLQSQLQGRGPQPLHTRCCSWGWGSLGIMGQICQANIQLVLNSDIVILLDCQPKLLNPLYPAINFQLGGEQMDPWHFCKKGNATASEKMVSYLSNGIYANTTVFEEIHTYLRVFLQKRKPWPRKRWVHTFPMVFLQKQIKLLQKSQSYISKAICAHAVVCSYLFNGICTKMNATVSEEIDSYYCKRICENATTSTVMVSYLSEGICS